MPGRRIVTAAIALLPFTACRQAEPEIRSGKQRATGHEPVVPADLGQLVELVRLAPDIRLDVRYATANNFTGRQLYDQPRAFLTSIAATALVKAHKRAQADGYGFIIYDAYRPLSVTRTLWEVTPPQLRNYVANPKKGSKHNRGCAIDMTLCDLANGEAVEMPTPYDEFSQRAHRDYAGASAAAIANRERLESYMQAEGFRGISNEWWHFDFQGWEDYPILDIAFDDIA